MPNRPLTWEHHTVSRAASGYGDHTRALDRPGLIRDQDRQLRDWRDLVAYMSSNLFWIGQLVHRNFKCFLRHHLTSRPRQAARVLRGPCPYLRKRKPLWIPITREVQSKLAARGTLSERIKAHHKPQRHQSHVQDANCLSQK